MRVYNAKHDDDAEAGFCDDKRHPPGCFVVLRADTNPHFVSSHAKLTTEDNAQHYGRASVRRSCHGNNRGTNLLGFNVPFDLSIVCFLCLRHRGGIQTKSYERLRMGSTQLVQVQIVVYHHKEAAVEEGFHHWKVHR